VGIYAWLPATKRNELKNHWKPHFGDNATVIIIIVTKVLFQSIRLIRDADLTSNLRRTLALIQRESRERDNLSRVVVDPGKLDLVSVLLDNGNDVASTDYANRIVEKKQGNAIECEYVWRSRAQMRVVSK
jgi:hypothetical protein